MLNDEEVKRLRVFLDEHRDHGYKDLKHFVIKIGETGISPRICVICLGCGKAQDISDYDSW